MERWAHEMTYEGGEMVPDPDGEWVLYEEAAAQIASLRRMVSLTGRWKPARKCADQPETDKEEQP